MDGAKAYLLPAVAALVLAGYYVWNSMADDPAPPESTPEAKAKTGTKAAPSSSGAAGRDPKAASSNSTPEAKAPPKEDPRAKAARDRAKRDALRERLVQAQRARTGKSGDAPVEEESLGQLRKEYIQQRVKEDLVPLAVECYESALEDDADIEGRLVMNFKIYGEPDVGGVVDEVEMAEDSEITHADMVECMRESMMSMSFDPPEDGGVLEVTYPFVFEAED